MVCSAEAAVKGISVARDNIVVVVVDDFRDVTVVDLNDVGVDYEKMGEGATVGKTSENKKNMQYTTSQKRITYCTYIP